LDTKILGNYGHVDCWQGSYTCLLSLSRRQTSSSSCLCICCKSSAFDCVAVGSLDGCEGSFSLCYGYI